MVIVKRLHTFMLQQFLPLLVMTFFICLFIVMMQFLWKYIDDLVGKGLSIDVIAELFYYAALSMVPMALPLAVLLASLMTFGNLGEKFELTALKAAGISLFQIMTPLIVVMVLIAIGAFFFQNNVLPVAQTKMYTLLFSMRQKSPEVEIPERVFYDQIPGMNLYVQKKNPTTGMLYDVIIYDITRGLDNSRVILADSGKMNFTEDKTRLFLHLYRGEMFENIRDNALGSSSKKYLPFRRESFSDKQIYMQFDANFNRIDEDGIRNQYVGKNISQLRVAIDSLQAIVDSVGDGFGNDLRHRSYAGVSAYEHKMVDSQFVYVPVPVSGTHEALDIDSVFSSPSVEMERNYYASALNAATSARDSYKFQSQILADQKKVVHRNGIEMHRKFTLSFACLIFFFIGAPLGAIIKKGGIGTPLVISVFLFIFYYIVDNTGYKMARDGKMVVWAGIWLSSAVLLPLGVFFTYKAVGDSQVFNFDSYANFFRKFRSRHGRRALELKEVFISEVDNAEAVAMLRDFAERCGVAAEACRRRTFVDRMLRRPSLAALNTSLDALVEYLSNSRDPKIVGLLNNYPNSLRHADIADALENTHTILSLLSSADQHMNN